MKYSSSIFVVVFGKNFQKAKKMVKVQKKCQSAIWNLCIDCATSVVLSSPKLYCRVDQRYVLPTANPPPRIPCARANAVHTETSVALYSFCVFLFLWLFRFVWSAKSRIRNKSGRKLKTETNCFSRVVSWICIYVLSNLSPVRYILFTFPPFSFFSTISIFHTG